MFAKVAVGVLSAVVVVGIPVSFGPREPDAPFYVDVVESVWVEEFKAPKLPGEPALV